MIFPHKYDRHTQSFQLWLQYRNYRVLLHCLARYKRKKWRGPWKWIKMEIYDKNSRFYHASLMNFLKLHMLSHNNVIFHFVLFIIIIIIIKLPIKLLCRLVSLFRQMLYVYVRFQKLIVRFYSTKVTKFWIFHAKNTQLWTRGFWIF